MAPIKSSLARTVGRLLGVQKTPDLSLRGNLQNSRKPPVLPLQSSGGTAYNSTPKGTIHRFTSSGSFVCQDPQSTRPTVNCTILVVGGGGAGGSFNPGAYGGGGGGGGGVRYVPTITLNTGATFPITVGDGGTGGNPYTTPAAGGPEAQPRGGGTNSVFNSPGGNSVPAITATGGGGGGVADGAGGPGGSGGGRSYPGGGGNGNAGGAEPRANPTSEGNPSNNDKSSLSAGSYGCGGGVGANPSPPDTPYQQGNPGLDVGGVGSPGDPWLPPAGNVFGGGGGGSSYKETDGNGQGGPGGGGDAPGAAGTEYTGGGGGGSGSPSGNGGNGGYGVVYVIIPTATSCTGSPG